MLELLVVGVQDFWCCFSPVVQDKARVSQIMPHAFSAHMLSL